VRKSRYSDEQIAAALRQAEAGTPVAEITRKLGISEATFYAWKKRFGSLGTPEIRELRQLREENARLQRLVADLTLESPKAREAVGRRIDEGPLTEHELGDEPPRRRTGDHPEMPVAARDEETGMVCGFVDDRHAVGQRRPKAHPCREVIRLKRGKEHLPLAQEDLGTALIHRGLESRYFHGACKTQPDFHRGRGEAASLVQ